MFRGTTADLQALPTTVALAFGERGQAADKIELSSVEMIARSHDAIARSHFR
jgi:hypothetical protein